MEEEQSTEDEWHEQSKRKKSTMSSSQDSIEDIPLRNKFSSMEVEESNVDKEAEPEKKKERSRKKRKVGTKNPGRYNKDCEPCKTTSGICALCKKKVCDLCAIGGEEMVAAERKCPDCFEKGDKTMKPKKKKIVNFEELEEIEKETGEGQIEWQCLEETDEDKQTKALIHKLLPKNVDLKIVECEMKEKSSIKEESKFRLKLEAKICSIEEAEDFMKDLEKRTQCNYNKRGREHKGAKGWHSDTKKCKFNVRERPGKEANVKKQFQCPATLSYRLKPCENCENCQSFNLVLALNHQHNHDVISCEALFFKPVDEDVKNEIWKLFENLNPPEKARRIYVDGLKEKFSKLKFLEISADRSINPDKKYYYNLYQKYWLKKLGTINGPDATQKTIELIDEYNKSTERKLASFKINEKNQTVVAVLDDLAERVHLMVPNAGDQVRTYIFFITCVATCSIMKVI